MHGMYHMANPDSGTNNLVWTLDNTTTIGVCSCSFTGVDQTTPVGAITTSTGTNSGTSRSSATTTTAANSGMVWGTREYGGNTQSSGTNYVYRIKENNQFGGLIGDSNVGLGAIGSKTQTVNSSPGGSFISDIQVEILAATAGPSTNSNFLMFMS